MLEFGFNVEPDANGHAETEALPVAVLSDNPVRTPEEQDAEYRSPWPISDDDIPF